MRIGYLTNSIKAGDVLGLTVEGAQEVCEGENFEWFEANGVGELDAESGLSAQYTAPASGANCPGNAEIWLSCGGEVVATLIITIDYEFAISFLYGDPELEIARNDSLVVSVEANGAPFTWAVSGTGFSLEHEETAGTGNVLHADETACGAATITVTDCDGNQTTGGVRCTTGVWGAEIQGCKVPGAYEYKVGALMRKVQGKYRQTQELDFWYGLGSVGEESCAEVDCVALAGAENCVSCLTSNCSDHIGFLTGDCGGWCCGQLGCGPYDPGPPATGGDGGYCIRNKRLYYQEWEC